MENDQLILYSSVKHSLMRWLLWRGTALAVLGGAILLLAGTLIPPSILATWGLILFLIGFGLITWGLLPFRRIKQLEQNPYQLIVDSNSIRLSKKGDVLINIAQQDIGDVFYFEKLRVYGVMIITKGPSHKKYFLPYFSNRAYDSLSEYLFIHTSLGTAEE